MYSNAHLHYLPSVPINSNLIVLLYYCLEKAVKKISGHRWLTQLKQPIGIISAR